MKDKKKIKNILNDPSIVPEQELVNLEPEFRDALLHAAMRENAKLHKVIEKMSHEETQIRDFAAMELFPTLINNAPNAEVAAEDAFKAADAFMRIRERGKIYKDDILEKLANLAESTHDNAELGAKIRLFLKPNKIVNET